MQVYRHDAPGARIGEQDLMLFGGGRARIYYHAQADSSDLGAMEDLVFDARAGSKVGVAVAQELNG